MPTRPPYPGMMGNVQGGINMMGMDNKQYQMGFKPQPPMPQGQMLRQQLQVRLVSLSIVIENPALEKQSRTGEFLISSLLLHLILSSAQIVLCSVLLYLNACWRTDKLNAQREMCYITAFAGFQNHSMMGQQIRQMAPNQPYTSMQPTQASLHFYIYFNSSFPLIKGLMCKI